jgi:hypothetical protein
MKEKGELAKADYKSLQLNKDNSKTPSLSQCDIRDLDSWNLLVSRNTFLRLVRCACKALEL